MTTTHDNDVSIYREQIENCARSLAVAHCDRVSGLLPAGETVAHVKMFTDGNLEKRFDKLNDQFEDYAEVFPELEDWIVEYVKTVPLAAYDTGSSDTGCFLDWLERTRELDAEQIDCATLMRGRLAVEELGFEQRLPHVKFQELVSLTETLLPELTTNRRLRIYLNPLRAWGEFRTGLFIDEADAPAQVLFFPIGNDIHTAVLEKDGRAVLQILEDVGPCSLQGVLDATVEVSREETIEIIRDLCGLGVAALG